MTNLSNLKLSKQGFMKSRGDDTVADPKKLPDDADYFIIRQQPLTAVYTARGSVNSLPELGIIKQLSKDDPASIHTQPLAEGDVFLSSFHDVNNKTLLFFYQDTKASNELEGSGIAFRVMVVDRENPSNVAVSLPFNAYHPSNPKRCIARLLCARYESSQFIVLTNKLNSNDEVYLVDEINITRDTSSGKILLYSNPITIDNKNLVERIALGDKDEILFNQQGTLPYLIIKRDVFMLPADRQPPAHNSSTLDTTRSWKLIEKDSKYSKRFKDSVDTGEEIYTKLRLKDREVPREVEVLLTQGREYPILPPGYKLPSQRNILLPQSATNNSLPVPESGLLQEVKDTPSLQSLPAPNRKSLYETFRSFYP
jgi:hypothetical protein